MEGDDAAGHQLVPTAVAGSHHPEARDELERLGLRFQTQRRLGRGGMASVLHAYDPVLGRHVAIKLLHGSLVRQPGELDAFVREARLTAQLEHPNIVPVYEIAVGPESDWACFAMKLVDGVSLGKKLAELRERRLEARVLSSLLELMLKVCDAVSYAHSRRVLHLDLKPDNVMIGSHGQVYVMDWGIAVRCTQAEDGRLVPQDRHGSVRGTLAYMAPEQLDRELAEVDQRADVYGLGAILYELLSGRAPFVPQGDGEDHARLQAHVVEDPLARGMPGLPPGLVQVAMRALAREPAQRYANVSELRAELERLRRGGGWFPMRTFAPGSVIIREGEPGSEAYLLVQGECEVEKASGGRRERLRAMSAGEVFGEMALLTGEPRGATVRALSETHTLVVTRETLAEELAPLGWLGTLVRALARRFREADDERTELRKQLRNGGAGP